MRRTAVLDRILRSLVERSHGAGIVPATRHRDTLQTSHLHYSYVIALRSSTNLAVHGVSGPQGPTSSMEAAATANATAASEIVATPQKKWLRDVYSTLSSSSEFDSKIFVSSFQLIRKFPRKECIRSFKQRLLDYSATAADTGVLSVHDIMNCLQAFEWMRRKTEEDARLVSFLIRQYNTLAKENPDFSNLPSSAVAGSSVALTVLRDRKEICDDFVSLVLEPMLRGVAVSGQPLSPHDIQVLLSNMAAVERGRSAHDAVLDSLCTIVNRSANSYTEKDVELSIRYCCELQSKSIPSFELMLCLLSKLKTTVSCSCVSEILYNFRDINCDSAAARQVLSSIIDLLPLEGPLMTPREIGRSLYGLQKMDVSVAEVLSISAWLNRQIMQIPLDIFFAPTDISASLYGIRGMSSDHSIVKDLMESLERELLSVDSVFEARHLGMCFTGITGKAEYARFRVVRLVDALTDKLIAFDEAGLQMKAGTVSSILNGISDLSLQEPCVRRIISVLVRQMERSQDSYTENKAKTNLAGILYAVRHWNIDSYNCTELKALLHTVSLKLAGSRKAMEGYDLAKCMYGLHSMTNNSKEVRNLLSVLHLKLTQSKNMPFDAVQIARCLYGLKSMSGTPEPLYLLSSLTDILENCQEIFQTRGVFMSVCAVSSMNGDSAEVKRYLAAITQKLISATGDVSSHDIHNFLHCCQNINSNIPEFRELYNVYNERYCSSSVERDDGQWFSSHPLGVLYPLRYRGMDSAESLALLRIVTLKLEHESVSPIVNLASDTSRGTERIIKAYEGITGFSSESIEVKRILILLTRMTESIDISPRIAAMILSSLRLKSDADNCVRVLLSKLLVKLGSTEATDVGILPPHVICHALGGLSRCSRDSVEVRSILQTFTVLLKSSPYILTGNDITTAIIGFRSMDVECGEVARILDVLTIHTAEAEMQFRDLEIFDVLHSIDGMCTKSIASDESNGGNDARELPREVRRFINALTDKIMPRRQVYLGNNKKVIDSLKVLSILQLFTCEEISRLRVALRRRGMI